MKTFSRVPGIELACALKPLSPVWRVGGIMQQIALAFEFGQNDCLFGDKERVVALAIESSYWCQESSGHGSKAAKREARLREVEEQNKFFDSLPPWSEEDYLHLAARHGIARRAILDHNEPARTRCESPQQPILSV